ncbi:hypothetical protein GQ53DRAFT_826852 [Thozetella sp. PMI_491]|nr:hypothetical protein GQ53DRAFT_826852 [Thozetella sp. PMI_491]
MDVSTTPSQGPFELRKALALITSGAAQRAARLVTKPFVRIFALHGGFVAGPPLANPPDEARLIQADVNNVMSTSMGYWAWFEYKLCPLAGMLSILLSLGGSIIPMEVSDYENVDAFQYQGMVATADGKVVDEAGNESEKT